MNELITKDFDFLSDTLKRCPEYNGTHILAIKKDSENNFSKNVFGIATISYSHSIDSLLDVNITTKSVLIDSNGEKYMSLKIKDGSKTKVKKILLSNFDIKID